MGATRFVVGIDLGTTNCALAYIDTGRSEASRVEVFSIPQVVQVGVVEERPLLPSFLYLPSENEQPTGALRLPWAESRDYAVGEFARQFGAQVPARLIASAKSWLCHSGVNRRDPILPWKAPEGARMLSPLEASTRYLRHLVEAWNQQMAKDLPAHRLEQQEVILTVPASFDAIARELTVEAARQAGLENLTLLEEPQAAFYAWLDVTGESWREKVHVGDLILVADVGGGTTDFSLIEVTEERGNLALTRLAVGDHLLLGGDNMDLALAHHVAQQLSSKGTRLDSAQMQMLSHSTRQAKEQLLSDPSKTTVPITVLGRGSKVIGGTIRTELLRSDLEKILLDGFFPICERDAIPARQRITGLQEIGLPYVADAAITRSLAQFLTRQAEALANRTSESQAGSKSRKSQHTLPTALLFNGGVFKAEMLRDRLTSVLQHWIQGTPETPLRVLPDSNLDLAVARGAAYYGVVRRGKGIRIRGGTARAYYIGVESAMPAIPGAAPPIKALCVAPFGMEEGTETDIPQKEFGLFVGEPVEFRFLGSTTRRQDTPGMMIEDWQEDIEELSPVSTILATRLIEGEAQLPTKGQLIPVHLHARVTEVGQLELSFMSREGLSRWKLEYNVRENSGT